MCIKAAAYYFQATSTLRAVKCHTYHESSFVEFGAAANFVIGKINNIYSAEMQISLRWGPMNN